MTSSQRGPRPGTRRTLAVAALFASCGCVIHEEGTVVEIGVAADSAVALELGPTLHLATGTLLLHEVHLEPCPPSPLTQLWRGLWPLGLAYAHSSAPAPGQVIQVMALFGAESPAVELHPSVGRYCGVTPLFAPGPEAPTMELSLRVEEGGPTRTFRTSTWTRPELPLAVPLILSAEHPEARVTLRIDGPAWFAGLDVAGGEPEVVGDLLLGRLGQVIAAEVEEGAP